MNTYQRFFILLVCSLLASTNLCLGQGENNIWCFGGGAGIDFNGPTPVYFDQNMYSREGCASISDANGDLLFYTRGNKIWDRNGNVMPNGTGMLGNGPIQNGEPIGSSAGGAVAIKSVTDPDIYYAFSLGAMEDGPISLWYSVVDMSLNGGLGDVIPTQKNILVANNLSEPMVTTRGGDCNSYWLIVRPATSMAQNFMAFKIDASGVSTTPVLSPTGTLSGPTSISNDGQRLFSCEGPRIGISAFNNVTGMASAPLFIYPPTGMDLSGNMALSPDDSKLYVGNISQSLLLQYDLSAMPNMAAVESSRTVLDAVTHYGLRTAPDGKIYLVRSGSVNYLSAINNPNDAGLACNYVSNAFSLPFYITGTRVFYSLGNPIVINAVPDTVIHATRDTLLCTQQSGSYTLSIEAADYYAWSTGASTQQISVNQTGTYWAYSSKNCRTFIDSFHVRFIDFQFSLGADTTICTGDKITLTANVPADQYAWQDGSTASSFEADGKGIYHLTATLEGCQASDTVQVEVMVPDVNIPERDTLICNDKQILLHAVAFPESSYLWQNNGTEAFCLTDKEGLYIVRATNICGSFYDSVRVSFKECQCEGFVPTAFSPNADGLNDEFEIKMNCPGLETFNFSIYNRYGQRVFSTSQSTQHWDGNFNGKPMDTGTYYYYLKYTSTYQGLVEKKGDLILIR